METAYPFIQTSQQMLQLKSEVRLIVFCMGITCSGKSTFIDHCTSKSEKFGAIKVGKEMRLRHPPERFNGLAAMEDTEDEVWEIFNEQLADSISQGKSIILVDGQPRFPSQVSKCFEIVEENGFISMFMWFFVENEELKRRVNKRFEGHIGAMNLARDRMVNDKIQLYDTMISIYRSPSFDFNLHAPKVVGPDEYDAWFRKLQDFDI